jgi:hypothetical protein
MFQFAEFYSVDEFFAESILPKTTKPSFRQKRSGDIIRPGKASLQAPAQTIQDKYNLASRRQKCQKLTDLILGNSVHGSLAETGLRQQKMSLC